MRKTTISFVMSVRPSVCRNGRTRFPLNGFSWNLTFEDVSKTYRESSIFIKIGQIESLLCMETNITILLYLTQFCWEWNIFRTNSVGKLETHILFSITFLENRTVYEIMWKNVERGRSQKTIWCTRIVCSIPKATNTHSDCEIFIAFPLQKLSHQSASMLPCTYIACLATFSTLTSFFVFYCTRFYIKM